MRILYIANLIPFPLDGGGKIFTYSTLQALSKENDIDLLCFYEHENIEAGKKELMKICRSVTVLPIKVTTRENMPLMMVKAAKSVFSSLPLGISKYITSDMKNAIKTKMKENKYDCAFFNILAMAAYRDLIKQLDPQIKTVLYEQNCEALIYKRHYDQASNILKKIFLKLETSKLEKYEQQAINNVDQLIVLSEEDKKNLGVKSSNCEVIPIGVQPSPMIKQYNTDIIEKIKLLFVGTMTWAPNNEGIIWFLENVMPLCADSGKYELTIVGKNPSEKVQHLCAGFDNVHLMGYVESLDDVYEACDVLIVPLFIGSGQRVKIIEAFSRGYAVISTSIGAEGLKYSDGETIMIADDAAQFKKCIDAAFDGRLRQRVGSGGKEVFDNAYSTDVIARKINSVIR